MNKPQITQNETLTILAANRTTDKVSILAVRGYFLDSYGKRGQNDRNVYDDAIIVISPRRFETFRANTDPSVYKNGVATMTTGVHRYYRGKHKNRYWALRLVGEQVPVTRDGESGEKTGIALNIHKGGNRSTGSLGCQTLMPADWDDFIELVYDEMDFYNQKTIPYVLIDEKDRRAGKFQMKLSPDLSDHEIDDLLNDFNENEPAVQVGKHQDKPTLDSAINPSAAPSNSQSSTAAVPPKQPVSSYSLDTLNSYIGGIQAAADRAAQVQNSFAPISKSSWAMALLSKLLGIVLFVFALLKDNWKELLIAALLIAVAAFIYSKAKDRAVAKQMAQTK